MSESQLIGQLQAAGLRATAARRAVIQLLEEHRAHLSAEDIYRLLQAEGVRINLSSVYRALATLTQLGLIRPVAPAGRHTHFEVGHDEQVHMVCRRCGRVFESVLPGATRLARAVQAVAEAAQFGLAAFTVEVTGECAVCSRSAAKEDLR